MNRVTEAQYRALEAIRRGRIGEVVPQVLRRLEATGLVRTGTLRGTPFVVLTNEGMAAYRHGEEMYR